MTRRQRLSYAKSGRRMQQLPAA